MGMALFPREYWKSQSLLGDGKDEGKSSMHRLMSILVPARNEMFLKNTIEDILSNIEADTEVIAVLDGYVPDRPLPNDPRVRLIHHAISIGQRAASNEAARLSTAKYVMKCDAHCAFDKGFDRKLIEPYESGEIDQNTTTIARMYNLHVFDWQCRACGDRQYQGPKVEKCAKCHKSDGFEMVMVWKPRMSRRTDFARFDNTLHFQYWAKYEKRPESRGDITDTMSSVGASFFMHRRRFFEIDGLDEQAGFWGQFGTEVSCKSWLSGGRQVVNKTTWFSHMFRTQQGFSFPYHISGNVQERTREYSRDFWFNNRWKKQIRPVKWIVDKFAPVPDWD
ncbi:MAG: glycosyltransferase [candidate division Zixibacteria bacterium]|nr:glycosyltransferase [candidate division Zixibacteria bacterium]